MKQFLKNYLISTLCQKSLKSEIFFFNIMCKFFANAKFFHTLSCAKLICKGQMSYINMCIQEKNNQMPTWNPEGEDLCFLFGLWAKLNKIIETEPWVVNKWKIFFKLGANLRGIKTWVKLSLIILPFISLLFIILVCPSYSCYATIDAICCRNTNVCEVLVWIQSLQRDASQHTAKELF